jgi:membrane fusion protein, multidrug efflux system
MMSCRVRPISTLSLVVVLLGSWPAAASAEDPVVSGCVVKVLDRFDVELPAKEAGVLVQLGVHEGSNIQKGELIGKIDDLEAQKQSESADFARRAALKKATDTVQIRYAEKSAEVAKAGYQRMIHANEQTPGSVPDIDVLEKKLEWDASVLSAEKAKNDQDLAKYEYAVKKVEHEAAKQAVERRAITAPFAGEVFEILRQQGEWVGPGDTILRLVQLDTMQVEGSVDQSKFDPYQIQNCEVTVEVALAHNRTEQFNGRIVHVSPEVRYDGTYVIRAEIPNRQENGRWVLSNQMTAKMTIHLDTGGAAPINVSRAP